MKKFEHRAAEEGVELYDVTEEQTYYWGASEMRKSLRCETCRHSYNENGLRCSNAENPIGNGGWNLPEGFGCTQHEQKKEKP